MKSLTFGRINLKAKATLSQIIDWQDLMMNLSAISLASYKIESLVLGQSVHAYTYRQDFGEEAPKSLFANLPVTVDLNSSNSYAIVSSSDPLAVALNATEVPLTRTINLSEGFCLGQTH